MPTLREQLLAMTPAERRAAKAEWHRAAAAALSGAQRTFTRGLWVITISNPRVGEWIDRWEWVGDRDTGHLEQTSYWHAFDGFEVTVTATRAGVPVPLENPFRFINPPLCTVAGDGTVVEGVFAAQREMIADAVRDAVGA